MIKKIETMVSGLGEISIDALSTWFPKQNKEELINEISKSEVVEIVDNVVMKKKKNNPVKVENKIETETPEKKEVIDNTLNNISIKVEESKEIEAKNIKLQEESKVIALEEKLELPSEEITLKEIEELIAKYNKSVQAKCEEMNTLNYEKKLKAIQKYYEERFNVKKLDTASEIGGELFSLLHKTKGIEVAYLYVSEDLDQQTVSYLAELYQYDTMYFCPLNKNDEIRMPMAEFYLKDTDEVIDNYKEVAKISKKTLEVLEIE